MFIGLNTPEDYLRVIKNHRWLITIPILIGLLLAALVYWWLPKTYRAYALINFGTSKVMHVQGVDDSSSSQHSMESQSAARINAIKEVVYGRELLIKVADEFHLYGYDKDHAGQEVADAVAKAMRFAVKLDSKEAPFVRLSFANADPVVARDATMRLAELFIEENLQSRTVIAESSSEFFQHELDAMKVHLEKKEQALAQFKQTHLGQLPEQMDANLRVIDRLENEATAQQEMEKSLTLRMESIDKAIREYEDPTNESRAAKDPRLSKIKELERSLQGLRSRYKESYPDVASVRDEINHLKQMTTEEYVTLYLDPEPTEPDGTKKKRKVIDPYKAELLKQKEEVTNQLQLVHSRQARIASEIKKYESRIDATTVHQQELMTIQRDYENLQKSYQALLDKKLSIGVTSDMEKKRQGAQIRIIDPPRLPDWPDTPNIFFIMFGGLAIGCAVGFGSAFGMEILRRGYVTAEEIEMTLGLPVLATISQFENVMPGSSKAPSWRVPNDERLLALPSFNRDKFLPASRVAIAPELVAMWYPRSAVAEQYRVAVTRLGLMTPQKRNTVVVMASALMGEGKTSTSLNMAHVLSRDLKKKTIVVDCDLKRPMVQAYTGMESSPGLEEILLGQKNVEECLQYHEQLGIWIIPAGIEQTGTTALSHVDRLSELIENLRARFDYVILDSPPLLPVAESMLIVRLADIVVHVIRARSTRRDAVGSAVKMIGDERPIAAILNGVETKDVPYSYYGYGYGYGASVYESHTKQIG